MELSGIDSETNFSAVTGFPPDADFDARTALLVSWLSGISDPQARFAWLVERARTRRPLPEADRRPEFLVPGCQVRLWWVPELRAGRCWFRLDSDAVSLKAVGGLLCEFYSGRPPAAVGQCPPGFLDHFGLAANLAESRRRTVWRVRELIREFARNQGATPGVV